MCSAATERNLQLTNSTRSLFRALTISPCGNHALHRRPQLPPFARPTATIAPRIDDFVESLRVVTPVGLLETRRLPGSGAGPSPDRMFIGSEGTLGVISRTWMRLQPRPIFRAGASVRFPSFFDAARAVRTVAQAGLYPSNCRILDPQEAFNTGAAEGSAAILVLAFESGDHPLDARMARALECCADHRGAPEPAKASDAHLQGAAGIWRNAFIRMPYAREFLTPAGLINDTFETAITWDRFESLHDKVKAATERAILEATGVKGEVTCRFTHVYPDGPAPYFSFHALGRNGALLEHQECGERRADRSRRYHHSSSCRRSRSQTLVRPTAAGAFRRRTRSPELWVIPSAPRCASRASVHFGGPPKSLSIAIRVFRHRPVPQFR